MIVVPQIKSLMDYRFGLYSFFFRDEKHNRPLRNKQIRPRNPRTAEQTRETFLRAEFCIRLQPCVLELDRV